MRKLSTLLSGAAVIAVAAFVPTVASAYPGYGADTLGPTLVIDLTGSGASIVAGPSSQGPYDGTEDTYIGVNNTSGGTVNSISLSATATIFGFDGDGIDAYGAVKVAGSPDTTGYGGPISYFTGINVAGTSGTVDFFGGLANGATTYFSLEEPVTAASFTTVTRGNVPEPVTISLFGAGLVGAAAMRRRRKNRQV